MKNKIIYWRACCVSMILLTCVTYTPLVIPYGVYRPMLFGIPYTLWLGILITFGMVLLTFLAARTHPQQEE